MKYYKKYRLAIAKSIFFCLSQKNTVYLGDILPKLLYNGFARKFCSFCKNTSQKRVKYIKSEQKSRKKDKNKLQKQGLYAVRAKKKVRRRIKK